MLFKCGGGNNTAFNSGAKAGGDESRKTQYSTGSEKWNRMKNLRSVPVTFIRRQKLCRRWTGIKIT